MLLIDAANVVGARPTGWWRDRPAAARALTDQLRAARAEGRLEGRIVVVLEGAARRGVPEGSVGDVEVVHAAGEGDATITQFAATAVEPVVLVSADRALGQAVRERGGEVVGPTWLLDRIGRSG